MTADRILRFLQELGVENGTIDGDWVRASCPLAPWRHEKKTDKHPSFCIRIVPEAPSYWVCFADHDRGSLIRLLHQYWLYSGTYPKRASYILSKDFADAVLGSDDGSLGAAQIPDRFESVTVQPVANRVPVPESVLECYPVLAGSDDPAAAEIRKWLVETRRISLEALEFDQVRFQPQPAAMVFPVRDRRGVVIDLRIRKMGEKKIWRLTPKITRCEVPYGAKDLWYGEPSFTRASRVVLVEGELDRLRLWTLGSKNTLASMGGPSSLQLAALYHHSYLLAYDADYAGSQYVDACLDHLQGSIWIVDFSCCGIGDPGDLESLAQWMKVLSQKREKIIS